MSFNMQNLHGHETITQLMLTTGAVKISVLENHAQLSRTMHKFWKNVRRLQGDLLF